MFGFFEGFGKGCGCVVGVIVSLLIIAGIVWFLTTGGYADVLSWLNGPA